MTCGYRAEKCGEVSVSGIEREFNDRDTAPEKDYQFGAAGYDGSAYRDGKYHIKSTDL